MTLKIICINQICCGVFRERENEDCDDIDDDGGSNYCDCIHELPTVINNFIYLFSALKYFIYFCMLF